MKRWRVILSILVFFGLAGGGCYTFWKMKAKDVNPPEIKAAVDTIEVSIQTEEADLMKYVSAEDPEDGDVSDSILVEEIKMDKKAQEHSDEFQITFAAFDSSGNASELKMPLIYIDYQKPHFVLSQPLIFMEGSSIDILEYITAQDALDGDITPFISVEGAEKLTENPVAGVYNCVISVLNSVGDNVSLPINVYVQEASYNESMKPKICLTEYIHYLKAGESFDPTIYIDHIENLGSGAKKVDYSKIRTEGEVDTMQKGIYSVQYSYTSEEKGYTGNTILLVVVE